MMKKKALSLLLASTMIVSLAACGGSSDTPATDTTNNNSNSASNNTTAPADTSAGTEAPAESGGKPDYHEVLKDGITIVVDGTLTATVDNGQAEFKKQWEDAVGISLEIQQLDHSGYTDAVGRLFAGGDYPDAMIMSAGMYTQYAPTGLLWDMANAYDNAEFQSRITMPAINEGQKDKEGRLYGLAPAMGGGCVTYVKKAWLDAVGIDINTVKTYDDYYNMLKAFHDGDPDGNGVDGDTYGVIAAGFVGNEAPYINYLPEFWQGAYPAFYEKNGTWVDGFQEDATKEALLRLQKAYADGAIDPETLTASTKIAREKWFSNDQKGSAGVFTYWAGTWYQTLTDNLIKNEVNEELVQLPPIKEITDTFGGYLNREAPVWVIIDQGDPVHNQAVFDALLDTMLDGGTVQTLWVYGAEDVHWSIHAEEFVTNPDDPDKKKEYSYEEGTFHLKQSPNDANSIWKKNHLDPLSVISPLTNGYVATTDLATEGNLFFAENCVNAPSSPVSETYTNESGTIYDAKLAVVTAVVVDGGDVDAAMQTYVDTVGSIVDQCLAELNNQ